MNAIKFSIIIPAYKASFLHEAIQSCLCQSYENLELIIVDDYSPEDLISIVGRFSDLVAILLPRCFEHRFLGGSKCHKQQKMHCLKTAMHYSTTTV